MGIGTGIRLSANNGQQISSSFQKFQDFMPFPTKKHSMECFHHLHSFQLNAYSVYLWPRWNPLFLILLYCHLNLCHWYRYVAPYHPIPPIAVYCAIKYINAFLFRLSFCSNYFNTRHSTYSIADLPCAQTLKKIIMIEVNDLHKSFGKVKVLNGIHLEYHPGKYMAWWARMEPERLLYSIV